MDRFIFGLAGGIARDHGDHVEDGVLVVISGLRDTNGNTLTCSLPVGRGLTPSVSSTVFGGISLDEKRGEREYSSFWLLTLRPSSFSRTFEPLPYPNISTEMIKRQGGSTHYSVRHNTYNAYKWKPRSRERLKGSHSLLVTLHRYCSIYRLESIQHNEQSLLRTL